MTFVFISVFADVGGKHPAKAAGRPAKLAAFPAKAAEQEPLRGMANGWFCRVRKKAPAEGA
jgi:hypothetical protein